MATFERRKRRPGEFFAGGRGSWRSEASREDAELGGFEFKNDGTRDADFFARGGPDFFCEATDYWFGFVEEDVGFEGIFSGDGLGGAVRLDGTVVDATSEFVEAHAVSAEALLECGKIEGANVADCAYVDFCQTTSSDFAYTGEALDG